jgi:hypothetical protein
MRCFAIAGVLIALAWATLCATPALATPPDEPPEGAAYLDQSTRIKTLPHWVPGSGQWAKPTVTKVNPALLGKRKGSDSHSVTPIPIPAPQSAAGLGTLQRGQKRHSATPMPLPAPRSAAYKTFRYHRLAR